MNKNSIITILAVLVGLMAITLIVTEIRNGRNGKGEKEIIIEQSDDGTKTAAEVGAEKPGTPPKWGGSSITGKDVERVPDKRVVTNDFVVSGQGYHAKWGRGIKAGFRQHGEFVAEALVINRQKLGNGRFKIVEDRTFTTAREILEIGEADYFLALDTLPIDEVSSAVENAGKVANTVSGFLVASSIPQLVAAGAITKTGGSVAGLVANGIRRFKVANNGKSLKEFGIDVSGIAKDKVESKINDLSRKPKEIETMIRNVEGRTYRFTYIQEATGKPLNITAERVIDGKTSPVESEEEVWILCRCNSFIDAEFLNDGGEKIPQPGDKWNVNARSVARIVGVDGYCEGSLTCCRTDGDTDPGLWEFSINPTELDVNDDSGRKLGKISVGGGKSHVYVDGRTLRDITIKGSGTLNRVNKNSILYLPFNEKFIGDCHFAGKMTTVVVK